MDRLLKEIFLEKWKKYGKTAERKYVIGRIYSMKETSVIKRLQANNIIGCVYKTSIADKTVSICFTLMNRLSYLCLVLLKKTF